MGYHLKHMTDPTKGDSGGMSMIIRRQKYPPFETEYKHNARPEVGWVIRVGSLYARSYSEQDWWQTSTITKIIKDDGNRVEFQTLNSKYVWWKD